MNLAQIKEKVIPILRDAHITRAAIFGSVARGEADPHDVDVLVEMPRPYSLFTFLRLKNTLEDALHMKVDLVESSVLKSTIREHAMRDAIANV